MKSTSIIPFVIAIALGACKSYYRITSVYENKLTDASTQRIETEIKQWGTVKEMGNWYEKTTQFIDKELIDRFKK